MACLVHYRSPVSSIGTAALTETYAEHTWADIFARATAIGGLPVQVATIALSRPARPCFPDLESRNPNRLRLISSRLARACAPPRALAVRANASVAPPQAGLTAVRASAED